MSNIALFTKLKQIKRIDSANGRYYNSPAFPSVSTIIKRYQSTPYLDKWVKNVGKEAAFAKGKKASVRGTKVHNALFKVYQGKEFELDEEDTIYFTNILPVVTLIKPLMMEQPIIWQKHPEDSTTSFIDSVDTYGFGGSPDILGELSLSNFYTEDKVPYSQNLANSTVLIDYKTWEKPKYGESLIPICLQIAAYCAGINQCTKLHPSFAVREGMILASTPTNLYIYYISPENLNWYWEQFKIMLDAYHDRNARTHFNWKSLTFAAQDLSKNNAGKWEKGVNSKMPQRLYLHSQLDSIRRVKKAK